MYQQLYHSTFESYSIQERIVLQKYKYQQLQHTFPGSYSNQESATKSMNENNY